MNTKPNKTSRNSVRGSLSTGQRGSVTTEYVAVVVFSLIAVWKGVEVYMDRLAEHQDEYTQAISQPY